MHSLPYLSVSGGSRKHCSRFPYRSLTEYTSTDWDYYGLQLWIRHKPWHWSCIEIDRVQYARFWPYFCQVWVSSWPLLNPGDKDPYCTYDNQSLQWFTSRWIGLLSHVLLLFIELQFTCGHDPAIKILHVIQDSGTLIVLWNANTGVKF